MVIINSVANFYRYMYAIYVHCRKYTFICTNLETCILANISDKFSGMFRNKCKLIRHSPTVNVIGFIMQCQKVN